MNVYLLGLLSLAGYGFTHAESQVHFSGPSAEDWEVLRTQLPGRLFQGLPFAQPCFSQAFDGTSCDRVRSGYLDELTRSNNSGAYIQPQWETCQRSGEQCLLDSNNPNSTAPSQPPFQCQSGSIPDYFIDVHEAKDVSLAFAFSKKTGVPLVVKNTGHDYKGRSSAPHSLALWTHNLKSISYNPSFVPDGCSASAPGVTMGAGVQWGQAYAFADSQNITVVGGSDLSVGASGGWLQGGGHGSLSNTMGLGVDRVLQYKVVTPDGKLRIVNECQNQDLFFALRGGGGGTFGVVLESTILASPRVSLQTVILSFQASNATLTKELWTIMTDNGLKWANEGWGGLSNAQVAVFINPKCTAADAAVSMKPLIEFGKRLQSDGVQGAQVVVTEFPSWLSFFNAFARDHVAIVGNSLALASRLINKSNFATAPNRSELVSGLLAADAATPGLIILVSAPASFPSRGGTSVTDAWRESVYHVTVVSQWNWNSTAAEKKAHYDLASSSIDNLRRITPDAAYLNEADVYEPNHEVAFWGNHYPELLKIKQKYDPDRLLDCWQCVGWNPQSSRFSCYL